MKNRTIQKKIKKKKFSEIGARILSKNLTKDVFQNALPGERRVLKNRDNTFFYPLFFRQKWNFSWEGGTYACCALHLRAH